MLNLLGSSEKNAVRYGYETVCINTIRGHPAVRHHGLPIVLLGWPDKLPDIPTLIESLTTGRILHCDKVHPT